jgi:hypothetical protein
VYFSFETWCEDHGHHDLLKSITINNIINSIRQVQGFNKITSYRRHGSTVHWSGVRLRDEDDED